jgi:hypothetical protein
VEPSVSSWGSSWGLSWGVSWGPVGVAPASVPLIGTYGGGGGWTGVPRDWEEPPVIRLRPSRPGSKALRLGDTEQPVGAARGGLANRGALGDGAGRAPRVVRPSVGVAAVGLGGPAPPPGGGVPGGPPRPMQDEPLEVSG